MAAGGLPGLPATDAPECDVIEIDEVCVRQSPPCWLWIAVSRIVGHALSFAFGDRTDTVLEQLWSEMPEEYKNKPICTDHWGAYERFFPAEQHESCDKGSGKTSIAEAMNTKWRQRQSGLVRRSCGTWTGIETDLAERFLILLESHNHERIKRWQVQQGPTMA